MPYVVGTISFICVVAVTVAITLFIKNRSVYAQLNKSQELLASERAGRVTGEKRLRKLLQEGAGERFKPIGHIKSPFKSRTGCPRQGGLVPHVRSEIVFDNSRIQPENSLDGITAYSHVWLIWEFHNNTNLAGTVKAKVKPPRAGGAKIGLYATRTPHRHNNIGLSLVQVDRLGAQGKTLIVRGADLLDGTPILDIKPYTPAFEAVPLARVPAWVGVEKGAVFRVQWSAAARAQVAALCAEGRMEFYGAEEASQLELTLADIVGLQDIRSRLQRARGTREYSFEFDRLRVHIDVARAGKQLTGDMCSVSAGDLSAASGAEKAGVEEVDVAEGAVIRRRSTRVSTARAATSAMGEGADEVIPTRRTTRSMSRGRATAETAARASVTASDEPQAAAADAVADEDELGVVVITAVELLTPAELAASAAKASASAE